VTEPDPAEDEAVAEVFKMDGVPAGGTADDQRATGGIKVGKSECPDLCRV
jgi:hypothetical protein